MLNGISTNQIAENDELLKKTTTTTLTECLAASSPSGNLTVSAVNDDARTIRDIESDRRLLDCGRCSVIEQRDDAALAVTTDTATANCLKAQLRANYPDKIIIAEPQNERLYRIKKIGNHHL